MANCLIRHQKLKCYKTEMLHARLEANFKNSLKYYDSLPQVWVDPIIADTPENSIDDSQATILSVNHLIKNLKDTSVYAPHQFGLTSLGHYLAFEAWQKEKKFLLYIDAAAIKNYEAAIKKHVTELASSLCINIADISGIILDDDGKTDPKKIKAIKSAYPQTPLIFLSKMHESDLPITQWDSADETWSPQRLFLWALTRPKVRETVSHVINQGLSLEEDFATQKLIDDLEALNLHRTPLNCLTLLAVYQQQHDFRPANRTDMIEKFLYLIFGNHKKRSDYSEYPDMKDSLYVLGAFCETLVREERYTFTAPEFNAFVASFCHSKAINIDIAVLSTILRLENIVVERNGSLSFKFSAWIYFFAAHRMYHSDDFREYICSERRYMNFPEVIEFYTGIDRRRDDLIELLASDLQELNDSFEERSGIHADFDPFADLKWTVSEEDFPKLKAHVEEEVLQSNLPTAVKDEIADRNYDRTRPYQQSIVHFTEELSLRQCVQVMKASARALRNSDFIDKDKKVVLLQEIVRTMRKLTQSLVILSPILAHQKFLSFENLNFKLNKSFDEYDENERVTRVAMAAPFNVVNYYEKDIASSRMSTLFIEYIEGTENEIEKLLIASVLMRNRSKGWKSAISMHMRSLGKNSFYLYSLFQEARNQFLHGFHDLKQKSDLTDLLGIAVAKHTTGVRSPNQRLVQRKGDEVAKKLESESSKEEE